MRQNFLKAYCKAIIETLYHQNYWFHSTQSNFLNLMIFIYYLQVLSCSFESTINVKEEKLRFLSKMMYYMNFTNLYLMLESKIITISIYFICFSLLIFLHVFICLKIKTKKKMIRLEEYYTKPFQIFFWVLLIPVVDTLSLPFQCDEQNDDKCFSSFNLVFQVFSIFGLLNAFCIGLAYIMFFPNIIFINVSQLNFKEGFCPVICFLIRFIIPIIFPHFKKDYIILVYVLQILFLLISIFDYFKNLNPRFPICRIHSILQILLLFALAILVLHNYKILINEDDFFVLMLCLGVLSCKIGNILFQRLNYAIVMNTPFSEDVLICNLEEIMRLFHEKKDKYYSRLILSGALKFHQKSCSLKKCKFSKNKMVDFWNLNQTTQNNKMVSFINFQFLKKIEKERKSQKMSTELVFKYISFLVYFNTNFAFSYYQIQRLNLIYHSKGMLENILVQIFLEKIESKMKGIRNQILLKTENNNSNIMDTSKFIKLNKKKGNMEKSMVSLLNSRIEFWEKYRNGFSSYEEIMKEFIKENSHISNYEKKYVKTIKNENFEESLLVMKFSSLFYCVALNFLNQGFQIEEYLEKLRQKMAGKDEISNLSLFENNLIICEASFLNKKGIILESSKNDKVMNFFGYELHETQAFKTIQEFMPNFIAQYHPKFISNVLSKNRKNDIMSKSIKSFGKNKKNFVFPINFNLGFSLHYANDFIIHAAIRKEKIIYETILFDKNGCVHGVTESFYKIFKTNYPKLEPKDFDYINIFILIPGLKQIIQELENKKWKDIQNFRNLNSELIFPKNLEDIVDLFKFKEAENEKEEEENLKELKTNRGFEKTFFPNINESNAKRTAEQTFNLHSIKAKKFYASYKKKFNNGILSNKEDAVIRFLSIEKTSHISLLENLKDLIETKNSNKLGVFYDLLCNIYRFGKKEEDNFILFTLNLTETFFLKQVIEETHTENIESSKSSPMQKHLPQSLTCYFEKKHNLPNEQEKDDSPPLKIENRIHEEGKGYFKDSPKNKQTEDEAIKCVRFETSNNQSATKKNKILEEQSKSSSLCTTNKSNETFEVMKKIEKNFPLSLVLLILFSVIDVILVLIFGITIFLISNTYIETIYDPLQVLSINQCRYTIGIDLSTMIVGQFEYDLHGVTNLSEFQYTELNRILNLTYQISKEKFYKSRNRIYNFAFGEYLTQYYYPYIDYLNPAKVNYILGTDLTDKFLSVLYGFVEANDYNEVNVKIVIRNLAYLTKFTRALRETIQATFVQSNLDCSQNVMNVMIYFLLIMAFVKFLEFIVFNIFYGKITKIIKIFLRVNDVEAFNEIYFLKDVNSLLKDQYIEYNFADLRANKNYLIEEENFLNTTKKLSVKNSNKAKKKKNKLQNLKSFSKLKVILLLTAIILVEFGYCFGTYNFWSTINDNILKLIEINTMFNDLYIFTTTAFMNQLFVVRDKIFLDPEYVASGESIQTQAGRQSHFDVRYRDRLQKLKIFISNLPSHALAAQNIINNEIYDELMQGNVCKALKEIDIIGDYQMNFCETMFDQALTKGIFSGMNQFTLYLSNRANISAIIDPKDTLALAQQKAEILEFLKDPIQTNVVIIDFYLSEAIYLFYLFLSGYYSGVLNKNIENLTIFMWVFCSGITVLMAVFVFYVRRTFAKLYRSVACSFAILPYAKIASDEQTVSLIKDYWKRRNGF